VVSNRTTDQDEMGNS